jgi:hypothetical protein
VPGPLTFRLRKDLQMFRDAPMTFKSYFVEHYTDGAMCAVNQKPREVTIFYYCDYFATNAEFTMLELSEPDWCKYHVKVASKYMCGKGNMQFKYDAKRGKTQVKCMHRTV